MNAKLKAIFVVMVVLFVVNFFMGYIGGYIPSLGEPMIDGVVTAFINAILFLWLWNFLKGKF
jgi:hypothetical protein